MTGVGGSVKEGREGGNGRLGVSFITPIRPCIGFWGREGKGGGGGGGRRRFIDIEIVFFVFFSKFPFFELPTYTYIPMDSLHELPRYLPLLPPFDHLSSHPTHSFHL